MFECYRPNQGNVWSPKSILIFLLYNIATYGFSFNEKVNFIFLLMKKVKVNEKFVFPESFSIVANIYQKEQ